MRVVHPRRVAVVSASGHHHHPRHAATPAKPHHQLLAPIVASTITASVMLSTPDALAFGPVSVPLTEVEVAEVPCKAGTSLVTGGNNFGATCLRVSATADNSSKSAKVLYNADVFGRVYDATGEPALDATENTRIAYIDEIPPGKSRVAFTLVIAEEQARFGAVKIKGLKATGFPGKMLPGQGSGALNECDPDVADILGCDEGSAVIR